MADNLDDLRSAMAELDDSYLKVMFLLAVRRASGQEPRRAGFWHSLAGMLSDEQERRQGPAPLREDAPASPAAVEAGELEAVLDELRRDLEALEAEYRESYGEMSSAISPEPSP